jgi:hypothetical protein
VGARVAPTFSERIRAGKRPRARWLRRHRRGPGRTTFRRPRAGTHANTFTIADAHTVAVANAKAVARAVAVTDAVARADSKSDTSACTNTDARTDACSVAYAGADACAHARSNPGTHANAGTALGRDHSGHFVGRPDWRHPRLLEQASRAAVAKRARRLVRCDRRSARRLGIRIASHQFDGNQDLLGHVAGAGLALRRQ